MNSCATTSEELESRAACLINPASGIANDYLNTFNEVLLLIENMPVLLPEMLEDLERWKPVTYRDYFASSPLPGSAKTLVVYDKLDRDFRTEFERKIARVSEVAIKCQHTVLSMRKHSGELEPDEIAETCVELAGELRSALGEVTDIVNHGSLAVTRRAQQLADELMNVPK